LRPANPKNKGTVLFRFSTDRATSGYVSIATVDYYDGDGWTFTRTFRPSGGVIPDETDPTMRPPGPMVTQQYTITKGAMTTVPWMPYLNRAERVTGAAVNIDPDSGMIVPSGALHAGDQYTVRSRATSKDVTDLSKTSLLGTSASQVDTTLPNGLTGALNTLIGSLAQETGASSDQPIPFLQAVAKDFRTNSALAGGPATRPTSTSVPGGRVAQPQPVRPTTKTPKPSKKTPARATPTRPRPTPTPSSTSTTHTGGTTFADVLASIRGSHSATPEQYATLTALIARKLGIPARLVAGLRIKPPTGSTTLPAGSYEARAADAWTWVEIPVRGLGWVVLDPSPQTYAGQAPQNSDGSTPTPSPTPTGNALVTHANNGHAVAPRSKTPHAAGASITSVLAAVLIVVLALVAVVIAALLARKRVRARRRRRAGDPRRRLLGAWQESLDVLTESGLPDLTYLTSAEVAATTGERFGGAPAAQARYIGDAANVALFSPTSWIGPAEADAAWRAHAVLIQSVRRRLGWRDRISAGLRYSRTKRRRPQAGPTSWAAAARARATGANRGKHVRRSRPSRNRNNTG
ncbi:MAG: DUF3488 and transglutaminase-like domain-containing protein, partial [Jatrophihabitans sp.]|uniref:DUF3488 and transglutaminase-like domain-containing protein n=1 Tax=Jatrophihabitans sp. TaxID=1932789 RepID=UPI003913A774